MTDNKKMAEFLSELRNRNEMPINEDEYNLLGEIADYLIDERQRPTGHWIVKKDKNEECYGVCSECGKEQIVGMLNYCPYCGAEMANRRSNHDR